MDILKYKQETQTHAHTRDYKYSNMMYSTENVYTVCIHMKKAIWYLSRRILLWVGYVDA